MSLSACASFVQTLHIIKTQNPAVAKVKLKSARVQNKMEIWTRVQRWKLLWRMQIHSFDNPSKVWWEGFHRASCRGAEMYPPWPGLYLWVWCRLAAEDTVLKQDIIAVSFWDLSTRRPFWVCFGSITSTVSHFPSRSPVGHELNSVFP